MSLGRPKPESLLAWAAALVGAIGIASALTPEFANRYDLVKGVLPPGVPTAARVFALAFGIALVWLSRSLARRKQRAWQLAVVVVIAAAIAHLAKGLDFEESTSSLLLLAALLRWRRRFDVPGDPRAVRPVLLIVIAALAATLVTLGIELRGAELPDRAGDLFTAVGLLAGFAVLGLWLRPLSEAVAQTVGERRVARDLVEKYGSDSLSFFALRRDKSFFFSPTRRAFLAYRVVSGAALVSGDPVGDAAEFDALLAEFRRVAHARGWRLAILGALAREPAALRAARDARDRDRRRGGAAAGDVLARGPRDPQGAAVRVASDEGGLHVPHRARRRPRRRPARGARSRLRRVARQPGRSAASRWRWTTSTPRGRCSRSPSPPEGEVGGFIHLAPSPAGGGWSLSTMRRRPATPNGLMEFLVVETSSGRRSAVSPRCRSTSARSRTSLAGLAVDGSRRLLRRALLAADTVFQLERLHSFSRKFLPDWRPRYLCVEKLGDLPLWASRICGSSSC